MQKEEQILLQEVHIVSQEKIFLWKIFFPWQEIVSCDSRLLPVTENVFLWQEIFFAVRANFFLWQPDLSCVRKFLPVTGIFFLWQEISSKDRKFLPVERKLLHTISLWGRNIILVAELFCNILFHLLLKKLVKITHLCCNFERKNHAYLFPLFQAKLFTGKLGSQEISNFLPPWARVVKSSISVFRESKKGGSTSISFYSKYIWDILKFSCLNFVGWKIFQLKTKFVSKKVLGLWFRKHNFWYRHGSSNSAGNLSKTPFQIN